MTFSADNKQAAQEDRLTVELVSPHTNVLWLIEPRRTLLFRIPSLTEAFTEQALQKELATKQLEVNAAKDRATHCLAKVVSLNDSLSRILIPDAKGVTVADVKQPIAVTRKTLIESLEKTKDELTRENTNYEEGIKKLIQIAKKLDSAQTKKQELDSILVFLDENHQKDPFLAIDFFNAAIELNECMLAEWIFQNRKTEKSTRKNAYIIDLHSKDSNEYFPYHYVRRIEAANLLKRLGANPNAIVLSSKPHTNDDNRCNKTALMSVVQSREKMGEEGQASLGVVDFMLNETVATQLQVLPNGANVYHVAANSGDKDTVARLSRYEKMNPLLRKTVWYHKGKEFTKCRPIDIAVVQDNLDVFAVLLSIMVSTGVDNSTLADTLYLTIKFNRLNMAALIFSESNINPQVEGGVLTRFYDYEAERERASTQASFKDTSKVTRPGFHIYVGSIVHTKYQSPLAGVIANESKYAAELKATEEHAFARVLVRRGYQLSPEERRNPDLNYLIVEESNCALKTRNALIVNEKSGTVCLPNELATLATLYLFPNCSATLFAKSITQGATVTSPEVAAAAPEVPKGPGAVS